MKAFGNKIWMSARESVYFVAVSLLLLQTGKGTMENVDIWMAFVVTFLILLDAMAKTVQDSALFKWDKVAYLSLSAFAIIATGIKAFGGQTELLGTIVLVLAGILCVYFLAEGITYQILKSTNKWHFSIPFEETIRLWFANNIAYLSLLLALYHSLTL